MPSVARAWPSFPSNNIIMFTNDGLLIVDWLWMLWMKWVGGLWSTSLVVIVVTVFSFFNCRPSHYCCCIIRLKYIYEEMPTHLRRFLVSSDSSTRSPYQGYNTKKKRLSLWGNHGVLFNTHHCKRKSAFLESTQVLVIISLLLSTFTLYVLVENMCSLRTYPIDTTSRWEIAMFLLIFLPNQL